MPRISGADARCAEIWRVRIEERHVSLAYIGNAERGARGGGCCGARGGAAEKHVG
eukprot:CAMPEP_0185830940 /NCGR_PEP_ID=MMETSP1353-20130828/1176_1 /TAXON_ID=1077150 /ORGANISM="Erythrolobus australicus, Strain CCMP3124" /LENGTH=54 /DNA_ID=CAMNT_0028528935 /DNA_START=66 /DNA_END=226 /DNA_ORIENTATION=+